MKFMSVKYDTALQDVRRKHVFEAVDYEAAINATITSMWLLDNPNDTVETQLYAALDDSANANSFFLWDTCAILSWEDENTITVMDIC